jgi:hypothetical protein
MIIPAVTMKAVMASPCGQFPADAEAAGEEAAEHVEQKVIESQHSAEHQTQVEVRQPEPGHTRGVELPTIQDVDPGTPDEEHPEGDQDQLDKQPVPPGQKGGKAVGKYGDANVPFTFHQGRRPQEHDVDEEELGQLLGPHGGGEKHISSQNLVKRGQKHQGEQRSVEAVKPLLHARFPQKQPRPVK